MSIALTSIFGNEICVYLTPKIVERQESNFPGANGITTMHMGSRGRRLFITGTLRATGNDYATARAALGTIIAAIEMYLDAPINTYTFFGETYFYTLFVKLTLFPDGKGKLFRWNANGSIACDFICEGRQLI